MLLLLALLFNSAAAVAVAVVFVLAVDAHASIASSVVSCYLSNNNVAPVTMLLRL